VSPRVREDSVHPRLQGGASGRPLNFTVRRQGASLPHSIAGMIFTAAVFAGFACWFFAVLEAIGIWRFWPWAYRLGFEVVGQQLSEPMKSVRSWTTLTLSDVKAVAFDQHKILFRTPMPLFRFRINTPFPILGSVLIETDRARITGRIPLGPTSFLAAWLIAWTTGGAMAATAKPILGIGFVAFGWLCVAAMTGFSLSVERGRFNRAVDALLREIRGSAA
jgi:hypothetical protein